MTEPTLSWRAYPQGKHGKMVHVDVFITPVRTATVIVRYILPRNEKREYLLHVLADMRERVLRLHKEAL